MAQPTVFIYKRVLTDGERAWLYNDGNGRSYTELLPPTPTYTKTPTPTLTFTSTPSPTNTFIPGTPHSNGSGTCWSSQNSWETYTVYYDINTSYIPGELTQSEWTTLIEAAAQTWNNVSSGNFTFVRQIGSSNTVRYEVPNDESKLAVAAPPPSSEFITSNYILINPHYLWDANNTPIPSNPNTNGSNITYNLQNVVTHEFGHWLFLNHSSCTDTTMYAYFAHGEIYKIDLDTADIDAINWQYP